MNSAAGIEKKLKNDQRPVAVVCALIRDDAGRILLQQRNAPRVPDWHEKWQLPGGKIEYGETTEDALVRECKEETGYTVSPKRLVPMVWTNRWEHDAANMHAVVITYVCVVVGGALKKAGDHNVLDHRWVALEDIDALDLLPGTREVIAAATT